LNNFVLQVIAVESAKWRVSDEPADVSFIPEPVKIFLRSGIQMLQAIVFPARGGMNSSRSRRSAGDPKADDEGDEEEDEDAEDVEEEEEEEVVDADDDDE
jgi:hypothetical protein